MILSNPKEIWALKIKDSGLLVPPEDDHRCECFMAFPTEGDAKQSLKEQVEREYFDECVVEVVRLL